MSDEEKKPPKPPTNRVIPDSRNIRKSLNESVKRDKDSGSIIRDKSNRRSKE
ncbi:hypothetical protein SAMN06298216_1707 [Spirosomataceae bacterium TFI 002]|nr:hypothetical protein SAMN06298216_1707 [Spirosomataceae bacterium TFI 002]